MDWVKKILSFPIVLLVKIYQWVISPIFPATCRYNPSCSHYMIEAVNEWGPIRGLGMGLRRISRCHPWGGSGEDPVPTNKKKGGR